MEKISLPMVLEVIEAQEWGAGAPRIPASEAKDRLALVGGLLVDKGGSGRSVGEGACLGLGCAWGLADALGACAALPPAAPLAPPR